MQQINNEAKPSGQGSSPFPQIYFHGTRADLKVGDLIEVGFNSNYRQKKNAKYIILTATLDAAIGWQNLHLVKDEKEFIWQNQQEKSKTAQT
jgi:hypothetical protein